MNNLLSNALKNTAKGHIEVYYEVVNQEVKIGVTDIGCGIPQSMIDKIFERLEKIDSFVQGAGLGLAICKSIVEKMNGKIIVKSEIGLGSTFVVELPCQIKA